MPATAPAVADALGAGEFADAMAALGPFEPAPHLALAVSGGADSLALATLAAQWLGPRGGRGTVLTVNHGLRHAAAAEACWVEAAAKRLGLAHRTLVWRRTDGRSVSQARARDARYRLLEAAAAELGVLHVLLGHHREDNARTIAMRRARGAGPGLAGMPAVRELDRLRLLRPLLRFPRARLRATAASLGRGWIEDPTNRDPQFERSRTPPAAAATSLDARLALEAAGRAWLAREVRRRRPSELEVDAHAVERLTPPVAAEVLTRLVAAVGNAPHPPGRGRVEAALARLRTDRSGGLTLAGAVVGREGERLVVSPERATCEEGRRGKARRSPLVGPPFGTTHVVTDAAILIC